MITRPRLLIRLLSLACIVGAAAAASHQDLVGDWAIDRAATIAAGPLEAVAKMEAATKTVIGETRAMVDDPALVAFRITLDDLTAVGDDQEWSYVVAHLEGDLIVTDNVPKNDAVPMRCAFTFGLATGPATGPTSVRLDMHKQNGRIESLVLVRAKAAAAGR